MIYQKENWSLSGDPRLVVRDCLTLMVDVLLSAVAWTETAILNSLVQADKKIIQKE